jgi:hypothetical protein
VSSLSLTAGQHGKINRFTGSMVLRLVGCNTRITSAPKKDLVPLMKRVDSSNLDTKWNGGRLDIVGQLNI